MKTGQGFRHMPGVTIAGRERRVLHPIAMALAALLAVAAQQPPATGAAAAPAASGQAKQAPASSHDVIVTAIPQGPYPVTTHQTDQFPIETNLARQAVSDARLFSRCIKPSDAAALRQAIDGQPNRDARAGGVDQLVRDHFACYPNYSSMNTFDVHHYGACNPRGEFAPIYDPLTHQMVGSMAKRTVCQSFYDRGALVERALALYAPDLAFTAADLLVPAVAARLHARDDRLDRTRSKDERLYVRVTECLVGYHPDLALGYLRANLNSGGEARLRAALIGTSPQCLAGAKEVSADPSEFRVFLVDAIYAWAVALRGGDSLIPDPRPSRAGQ